MVSQTLVLQTAVRYIFDRPGQHQGYTSAADCVAQAYKESAENIPVCALF